MFLLLGFLFAGGFGQSQAQEVVILGSEVACRVAPSRSADARYRLDVGDVVFGSDSAPSTASQGAWLWVEGLRARSGCWVSQALTYALDRRAQEPALIALADYVLSSREGREVADFVRAHNPFVRGFIAPTHEPINVESSPILSLRALQLVDAAVSTFRRPGPELDPVLLGWALSHGSDIGYFEPGASWFVDRSAYERLYLRFRDSIYAEEILWSGANAPIFSDCESSADCRLTLTINSFAKYWIEFPSGDHIDEAIARGVQQLRSITSCERRSRYDPASPSVLQALRDSLAEVREDVRRPMYELLDAIERGCAG